MVSQYLKDVASAIGAGIWVIILGILLIACSLFPPATKELWNVFINNGRS